MNNFICVMTLNGKKNKMDGDEEVREDCCLATFSWMSFVFRYHSHELLPTACKHEAGSTAQGVLSLSQPTFEALDYFLENH